MPTDRRPGPARIHGCGVACAMMVSVRSNSIAWMLAGVAALAVAVTVLLAVSGLGDESGADASAPQPAAADTAATQSAAPANAPTTTEAPLATTTTTTLPSTTTTTSAPPPTTTSSVPPTSSANGYTPVPKPSAGPSEVAPGGALTKHLAADIATAFGLVAADVETAITQLELPPEADGNPEGWLAPGSYEFPNQATADEVVGAMLDRRIGQLEDRNLPRDQWQRVVTAASVIEKETYNQNEKPRVARVLANRLAGGGPLQMDSIILYPVPEDRIFTTREERASDQP